MWFTLQVIYLFTFLYISLVSRVGFQLSCKELSKELRPKRHALYHLSTTS